MKKKTKKDSALAIVKALAKEPLWKKGQLDDENYRVQCPRIKYPIDCGSIAIRAKRFLKANP